MSKFEQLYALNVNDKVEKKDGLSYLSWAFAWREFKKVYPDAEYDIRLNDDGLPVFNSMEGAMVYTSVKADNLEYTMWLPVMDHRNRAMKDTPYQIKTKNGQVTVEAYTMFDVNKTLMRCLVKNLAMFGLALYIYAGEDIPNVPIDTTAYEDLIMKCDNMEDLKLVFIDAYKECATDPEALKRINVVKELKKFQITGVVEDINNG